MARKDYIMARFEMNWGEGVSSVIGRIQGNTLELLDYENNTVRIHEECGGENFYQSRTGMTGAGYVDNLGEWFPVGHYRPIGFWSQQWLYVAEGIQMVVPLIPHRGVSTQHPIVLKTEDNDGTPVIIFCTVYNVASIVHNLLRKEELWVEPKTLKKTFKFQEVVIKMYNFFGETPNPWNFCTEMFYHAQVEEPDELYKLLGAIEVSEYDTDDFYHFQKLGGCYYATEWIGENLSIPQLARMLGWEASYGGNVLLKNYPNQVKVVAWSDNYPILSKKAGRVGKAISRSSYREVGRFSVQEESIQKMEFILNKDQIMKRIWSEFIKNAIERIDRVIEADPGTGDDERHWRRGTRPPRRLPRRSRPESDSGAN